MHWVSFVLGLLGGRIVERLIYQAYGRQSQFERTAPVASLNTESGNAWRDLAALRASSGDVSRLEFELATARARIDLLEDVVADLRHWIETGEPVPPASGEDGSVPGE